MTYNSPNYLIRITRLNQDGTRDHLNTLELTELSSAKRLAAIWSRELGVYATIFHRGLAIYQYLNSRQVAEITR